MNNTILTIKKGDFFYVKNNNTGCIVKMDKIHYQLFVNKDKETIDKLKAMNFFLNDTSKIFSLYIMVDNACNLSCPYCFEQSKNNTIMNKKEADTLIKLLCLECSKNNYETISITFTGGEPILNFKIIKYIVQEIKKKLNDTFFVFNLITNGTLFTESMLTFFNNEKFNIQVTLDGYEEVHNSLRFYKNNVGTFNDIINNLFIINNYTSIKVTVRVNITSNDFELYKDLFIFILRKFATFGLYIDFVDVGRNSKYFINNKDKLNFLNKFYLLCMENNYKPFYNFIEGGDCMVRNSNSFTINNNKFFRCYSFVDNVSFGYNSYEKLIESHAINSCICLDENCDVYDVCKGGCVYKRYVLENKVGIHCNYAFLKKINSYIFLNEVYKSEKNINYEELILNVEYQKINFN